MDRKETGGYLLDADPHHLEAVMPPPPPEPRHELRFDLMSDAELDAFLHEQLKDTPESIARRAEIEAMSDEELDELLTSFCAGPATRANA
ncbi:MAG: hypothetical protein ACJ8H8_15395 [Geminicoccaceae bacterium]